MLRPSTRSSRTAVTRRDKNPVGFTSTIPFSTSHLSLQLWCSHNTPGVGGLLAGQPARRDPPA